MKRHLCKTGFHRILLWLWLISICVDHVSEGQLINRPIVERTILDGGMKVVKITIRTNPLDRSGRVPSNVQDTPKTALNVPSPSRISSSNSVNILRSGNSLPSQQQSGLNQRGVFSNRASIPEQSQNSNPHSKFFRKLSLPPRTFDFRGNQITNDQSFQIYQPASTEPVNQNSPIFTNSQPQTPSQSIHQVNGLFPEFPGPANSQGPKSSDGRTGNALPIVKAITSLNGQATKLHTTSVTPTRNVATSSPKQLYSPPQLPANFIPEFSMINQFERQGTQLGSVLPNFNSNQNVLTNVNINGQNPNRDLQSNVNRDQQRSNNYQHSSIQNQPGFNQNVQRLNPSRNQQVLKNNLQQSNIATNPSISNINNYQGNPRIPNFNTIQSTLGQNQQISEFGTFNNNNQRRLSQQPQLSNFYNQANPYQWMSQFYSNQLRPNQQISQTNNNQQQFNNNQQVSKQQILGQGRQQPNQIDFNPNRLLSAFNYNQQGLNQGKINQPTFDQPAGLNYPISNRAFLQPFQRNNMAMQMARFHSRQNREPQNRGQWPLSEQPLSNPEFQTAQAGPAPISSQDSVMGSQGYLPIINPSVDQGPLTDIAQGQMGFGQANPTGQLEFAGNQGPIPTSGGTNPQEAGGMQELATLFPGQRALNSQGSQNQLNAQSGGSQSMRGNAPGFLQRQMLMNSYYERPCNYGATVPNGSEPMACNCFPRRECESQLFMYISPVTRRDCATYMTRYVCCCEDQRTVPIG